MTCARIRLTRRGRCGFGPGEGVRATKTGWHGLWEGGIPVLALIEAYGTGELICGRRGSGRVGYRGKGDAGFRF